MRRIGFVILVLLMVVGMLFSARGKMKFEHIDIGQGLSGNTVYCVFQDSQGFLWFGTESLIRYDGYNFRIFKHDPRDPASLSKDVVADICEDRTNVLWIGTYGGGLNRFDRAKETFNRYQNRPGDPGSLSHDTVVSIYEDRTGILWIGTWGGGLNRLERDRGTFTAFRAGNGDPAGLSSDYVKCIYEDRSGTLWVGTWGGGLHLYDRQKEVFRSFGRRSGELGSLSSDNIRAIFQDQAGILWIGTDDGLNKMAPAGGDGGRPGFILSGDRIFDIYESPGEPGILWIATDEGLNIFDKEKERLFHYRPDPGKPASLSSKVIRCIAEDSSGLIWLGTQGGGLNKCYRGQDQFTLYQSDPADANSLSYKDVYALCEDASGALWIGTSGGGLDRFDRQSNRFTHYRHQAGNPRSLSSNIVFSIIEDREGTLWIGTWLGGLDKFDRQTGTFTHFGSSPQDPRSLGNYSVLAIHEDQAGILWLGTDGGLSKFDRHTGAFTWYKHEATDAYSLSSDLVVTVYEDRSRRLWVGTDEGLDSLDRETGRFTHFRSHGEDPRTLSSDVVIAIYEDRSGRLWVGTDDGLNRLYRRQGVFSRYREQDGLPGNTVTGILEDRHGHLWIGTNKGLSRFNPRTGVFENYYRQDGLQSDAFNPAACCKSKGGELFFGGPNGFNIFNPDHVKGSPHIPPIVLTDFTVLSQPGTRGGDSPVRGQISEVKAIKLDYRQSVFFFEFAALDFANPDKNRYAYKLAGGDGEWHYLGSQRRITFANLPPGNYTLHIKGSNSSGAWNEEGVTLSIIITPPFWQTWWFRGLLGLLVIGILIKLYRLRIGFLTRRLEQEARIGFFCKKYDISRREREVMLLLLEGKSSREIEDRLYISMNTVKSHVSSIYQKLGVKNRYQLFNLLGNSHGSKESP